MKNRRTFLFQAIAGASLVSLPGSAQPAGPSKSLSPTLRFAVASDGHFGQEGTDYDRFHREMVDWLNDETQGKGLDFVIFNGDLVHDDPGLLPQLKKHYDRLTAPYFVVRGNHDKASPAFWKETWGYSENHFFERGDFAFLLVSTSNERGEYLAADTEWLRDRLEAFKGKKGIVAFLHIGQTKFTRHAIAKPEVTALFERANNLLAVFHGHDHDIDNVIYSNGRAYLFDGHMGGSWGANYRGYRVGELLETGRLRTYQCNPQAFYVNGVTLGPRT